jgi:hypothetical protein
MVIERVRLGCALVIRVMTSPARTALLCLLSGEGTPRLECRTKPERLTLYGVSHHFQEIVFE